MQPHGVGTWLVNFAPIELRLHERLLDRPDRERRLNLRRRIRIELRYEFASTAMNELAQLRVVIGEEHEAIRGKKFLPHEQQWRLRSEEE